MTSHDHPSLFQIDDLVCEPAKRRPRGTKLEVTNPTHNKPKERPRDRCGRLRSPATLPANLLGNTPGNKGQKYPPTPLTPDEVLAILDACPTHPAGRRDRGLITCQWRTGARLNEALSVTPMDVDLDRGVIHIRHAKNGKPRFVGIDEFGANVLGDWLAFRAQRGLADDAPVFCVMAGPTKGNKLGRSYVNTMLKKRAAAAGVRKRVASHQLRHSFACDLAREGVAVHVISKALGHSNLGVTSTYLGGIAPTEIFDAIGARPSPLGDRRVGREADADREVRDAVSMLQRLDPSIAARVLGELAFHVGEDA